MDFLLGVQLHFTINHHYLLTINQYWTALGLLNCIMLYKVCILNALVGLFVFLFMLIFFIIHYS